MRRPTVPQDSAQPSETAPDRGYNRVSLPPVKSGGKSPDYPLQGRGLHQRKVVSRRTPPAPDYLWRNTAAIIAFVIALGYAIANAQ